MARNRKGLATDIMELVSRWPWWVGVVLALLSYLLLHQFAQQPSHGTLQSGREAGFILRTVTSTLAEIGQYLLPFLCLMGSVTSAAQQRKRATLVADVANSKAASALDGMSWREFESLVGEGFRLQGYHVIENSRGGPDGGVDLVLSRPGTNGSEKYLVQCKQWRAYRVGVEVVRELYGVMAAKGAAGGFVVTSGSFTEEAKSFASGRNVSLVDGTRLHRLIKQAKEAAGHSRSTSVPSDAAGSASSREVPPLAPSCPLCSKPMAMRTAKRGANAGAEFWGCTGFPSCRGTKRIA